MALSRRLRIVVRWAAVLAGLLLASFAMLLFYGSALVDQALSSGRQSKYSRVLAAPLQWQTGDAWDVEALRGCLLRRGIPQGSAGRPGAGEFITDGRIVWLGGGLVEETSGEIGLAPTYAGLRLLDASGQPLAYATLRPNVVGTSAPNDVVRWPVPIDQMAPIMLTAVVDIEDRGFLSHAGLSFKGLLRAALRDLVAGGVRQGGSTITQQLAKILLLKPARTMPRKVFEAWLATLLEYRLSKRAILEAYLNRVYLGQDGGWQVQGVEAAAHFYFGKRAAQLNVEEAALLAGLIAAPNRFDPLSHAEAARTRRNTVLAAMAHEGHLDTRNVAVLAALPLPRQPHRLRWPLTVHFVEYLLAHTSASGDLRSTLDLDVQEAVRGGCQAGLQELEGRYWRLRELARGGDPLQVAVVALTPDGRLLALQGSRAGLAGEFNRAVLARRQVGSLVKPFIVGTAFAAGWTAESTLLDEPLEVNVGHQVWRPENSEGNYRGVVTVHEALVHSLNVPMVRLGLEVSVASVAATLRRVGLPPAHESPAMLLGAFEASPLEIARAYSAFLDRGSRPTIRLEVGARVAYEPVLAPSVAASVLGILEDVPRQGTAAGLAGTVEGSLAAKTGTTDERRDSWFAAMRPRIMVVVWVGTDGNRETGLFGATGAMEIWRQVDARLPAVWHQGEFSR